MKEIWTRVIMPALLVVSVAGLTATMYGCGVGAPTKKHEPVYVVPSKNIGDGIYVAGKDISAGKWSPVGDWKNMKGCVWFVSPSITDTPGDSDLPTYRKKDEYAGKVTITLKKGQSLTTSGCGEWEDVG
jgi:hypothetical protein